MHTTVCLFSEACMGTSLHHALIALTLAQALCRAACLCLLHLCLHNLWDHSEPCCRSFSFFQDQASRSLTKVQVAQISYSEKLNPGQNLPSTDILFQNPGQHMPSTEDTWFVKVGIQKVVDKLLYKTFTINFCQETVK